MRTAAKIPLIMRTAAESHTNNEKSTRPANNEQQLEVLLIRRTDAYIPLIMRTAAKISLIVCNATKVPLIERTAAKIPLNMRTAADSYTNYQKGSCLESY